MRPEPRFDHMTELAGLAGKSGDVLRPYDELDVLPYYGRIAEKLMGFLRGRELASRIWTPSGRPRSVVISSPPSPPLYVEQVAGAMTPGLADARLKYRNVDEARGILSPGQQLTWQYFPSRRYVGFYYATNRSGHDREIDRAVYDISPSVGATLDEALDAVRALTGAIVSDDRYHALFKGDPFVYWTGSAFQVMLLTREHQPASFYRDSLEYTGKGRTLSDSWIDAAALQGGVKISGGSQRRRGFVRIDTDLTPPGKLCPIPIGCLDMADGTTLAGVSVPLTPALLKTDLLPGLVAYGPEQVLDELDELAARLPA